ncbi:sensor histidine kinase [Butyrivibrio sp. INlla21]|uniref:sensor histidine kinase n=1 Tax=Butyrivibrio sp. INlla21 TaxID=1520811 RepID=UPI0008E6460B|nr:sensor histidine kinase [Butyrivibrio sp. INlla21]SFU77070.1 two-component system, sensor histidine kinase YesM [Butyrivibrio sp. INlla21]
MRTKKHTLRNKIIIWALGFALILALAVAAASFSLSFRYLKRNQHQSAMTNIQLLGSEIDDEIKTAMTFTNWICLDTTLGGYLQNVENYYNTNEQAGRRLSVTTWDHLNNEYNIVGIRDIVNRVIVSTPSGDQYLQSLSGGDTQSVADISHKIMESEHFSELLNGKGYTWIGPIQNPLMKSGNELIIPIIKSVQSASSYEMIGWIYMDIPVSRLTSKIKSFNMEEDEALFITFSEGNTFKFDGENLVRADKQGDVISYILPNSGWEISYLPSAKALQNRMNYYGLVIFMIVQIIVLAGALLSVILHKTITGPVSQIVDRLDLIGAGDFSRDEKIEWDNELGDIGTGINNLAANVSALMEKRLLDEKAKQDLEYRVLQSQINPHFLYNTLNTIKWMATIQGSDGIADMSTALSRLMKNIAKGTENLITLRDEFALVDDYFTIMKYRYGGTISLEYITDDEALLDKKINRFSLQPIVENAIFHGIEPKGTSGKIVIHTYQKEDKLIIEVTDNGVGMSEEAIKSVLNGESNTSTEFFKQVGTYNVNQRIKYTFGEEYGIEITSKLGEYTTMRFVLPMDYEEDKK